jgi:hypothetical protein
MSIEVFEVKAAEFVSAYVNYSDGSWCAADMVDACGVFDAEEYASDPDYQETVRDEAAARAGWYYWNCQPGCLPDSEPMGPYHDRDEAWAHACDAAEMPLQIEISSDYELLDEDGSFVEYDAWETQPWSACPVVYCYDVARARSEGSIDGSSWESPRDMDVSYSSLYITGAAGDDPSDAFDALVERLKSEGYDVSVD